MTYKNKLGMFIHWGIYSLTGIQEQAMARLNFNKKEYEALANEFNPVNYNAEEWVKLAKSAGMKYICFTTKHHDGFCMWNTKYSDYNIMNTPYGKDVLKDLADACKKHGILLSLYYSNPDWNYKYGYNPNSSHQWCCDETQKADLEAYKEYIKNQITELLTNYGEIYTLFWDIPPRVEDASLNQLARKLQPNILINDRGWSEGDFSTPEREYEAVGGKRFTRMTEACNSVGEQSWGYRENEDFYSLRHITYSIDKIMSMGGSYLLNVGPSPLGEITPEYANRIEKIGDWYNRMEGCLEGAEEDLFNYESRPNNCIATKKNGKTYLHFYEGLVSSAVNLKKYHSLPKKVRLMNTGKTLDAKIEFLPEFFNCDTGKSEDKYLHITGIPIDDLENEPIVLEIEW